MWGFGVRVLGLRFRFVVSLFLEETKGKLPTQCPGYVVGKSDGIVLVPRYIKIDKLSRISYNNVQQQVACNL